MSPSETPTASFLVKTQYVERKEKKKKIDWSIYPVSPLDVTVNSKYQSVPGGRGWFAIAEAESSVPTVRGDPNKLVSQQV